MRKRYKKYITLYVLTIKQLKSLNSTEIFSLHLNKFYFKLNSRHFNKRYEILTAK